jgi:antitoxin (DNA-binding transcriptional repressor) of toxin-antitoxin stability system
MAATDLRVHLGEALRSLEDGDIIIEKGGIPVAVLSRYAPESTADERAAAYERALSQRGDRSPEAWALALEAMKLGWTGIDAEELKAQIYRDRDRSGSRYYDPDRSRNVADEPPAGQRRVYRSSRSTRKR